MRFAENLWLGATATQRGMSHMMNYSAAFYGNAALQAWKLGVDAPIAFWQAMSRAGEVPVGPATQSKPATAAKPPASVSVAATPPAAVSVAATPAAVAKVTKAAPTARAETKTVTPAPAAKAPSKPAAKAPAKPVAKVAALAPATKGKAPAKPKAPANGSKPAAVKAKAPATKPAKSAAKTPKPAVAKTNKNPHLLDAPRDGKGDDLTVMSGVGEKLALVMNDFGIYHFDQIADLNEAGIDWLNTQQPGFKAVIARFDLVGQAKELVK